MYNLRRRFAVAFIATTYLIVKTVTYGTNEPLEEIEERIRVRTELKANFYTKA